MNYNFEEIEEKPTEEELRKNYLLYKELVRLKEKIKETLLGQVTLFGVRTIAEEEIDLTKKPYYYFQNAIRKAYYDTIKKYYPIYEDVLQWDERNRIMVILHTPEGTKSLILFKEYSDIVEWWAKGNAYMFIKVYDNGNIIFDEDLAPYNYDIYDDIKKIYEKAREKRELLFKKKLEELKRFRVLDEIQKAEEKLVYEEIKKEEKRVVNTIDELYEQLTEYETSKEVDTEMIKELEMLKQNLLGKLNSNNDFLSWLKKKGMLVHIASIEYNIGELEESLKSYENIIKSIKDEIEHLKMKILDIRMGEICERCNEEFAFHCMNCPFFEMKEGKVNRYVLTKKGEDLWKEILEEKRYL